MSSKRVESRAIFPKVDLAGKIGLQNSSGGNFKNFILKKFSGIIPYCIILTINLLVSKIVNLPTTTQKVRFCLPNPPLALSRFYASS